jgi:16S rRNA (guanine(527)-N(7))-methyltransferase RsmG
MVTRETSLSQGLAAIGITASDLAIRRLALLADLLENDAVDLGFLGPNEGRRVISRHLLESAALLPHIPEGPVIDVGSGAGLPGLVLAALGRTVVLIESQLKRVAFLQRASVELGADAQVRHGRAEEQGRGDLRDSADTVVARALAAPAVALELCMPFVRPGGRLLLPTTPAPESGSTIGTREGAPPDDESDPAQPTPGPADAATPTRHADTRVSDPVVYERGVDPDRAAALPGCDAGAPVVASGIAEVAELLGGGAVRWEELSVPGADGPRWVMMVDKRYPTPDRFPRRPGVPKRRPLGGDVASVK